LTNPLLLKVDKKITMKLPIDKDIKKRKSDVWYAWIKGFTPLYLSKNEYNKLKSAKRKWQRKQLTIT
jgi:hypothetical protein